MSFKWNKCQNVKMSKEAIHKALSRLYWFINIIGLKSSRVYNSCAILKLKLN